MVYLYGWTRVIPIYQFKLYIFNNNIHILFKAKWEGFGSEYESDCEWNYLVDGAAAYN